MADHVNFEFMNLTAFYCVGVTYTVLINLLKLDAFINFK